MDFLRADCDTAFTFLRIARTDSGSDPEGSAAALDKAREALGTVRRLTMLVEDPTDRTAMELRADQLEDAISAFETAN